MTTKLEKEQDKKTAVEMLNRISNDLEKGGLVVVTIKGTSKSNLSFRMDVRLYATAANGEVQSSYLNWMYAQLTDSRQNDRGEVKWSSLGIDRAFEVANNLEHYVKFFTGKKITVRYQGIY